MLTISTVLAWVLLSAAAPTAAAAPGDQEAIAHYEAGRYDQARRAIEAIEADRQVSGALLYRLHFCRRVLGDMEGANDALERARTALEREVPASKSLEASFYLANSYANLGRHEDARRVAAEVTARFESGALATPDRPLDWFQLAKLYQDQGRPDEAARHYRKALDGFPDGSHPGNVAWARRFLGQRAIAHSDWAAVDREYGALVAAGLAEAADLDLLARARGQRADWSGAAEAWRLAVKADPTSADGPRYASRLAETAAALKDLPATTPEGAAWSGVSREALEAIMKTQADALLAARERASKAGGAGNLTPESRAEIEAAIRAPRPVFVAAGVEYALRGFPIRETAFREGYAVLIFQEQLWEWPQE